MNALTYMYRWIYTEEYPVCICQHFRSFLQLCAEVGGINRPQLLNLEVKLSFSIVSSFP